MKKILAFVLLVLLSCNLLAQKNNYVNNQITVDEAEKMVQDYIDANLNSFELPEQTLKILKESVENEKEHHKRIDDYDFAEFLIDCKKMQLRSNFFQENPAIKAIYETPLQVNQNRQFCNDPGFEPVAGGNPNTIYTFRTRNLNIPPNGASVDMITTGNDFVPFAIPNNYNLGSCNQFNTFATLVSPGQDATVPALNRVLNGQRAIKLNASRNTNINGNVFNGFNVTTMSRQFVVNENFFQFNYSLIL